MQQRGPASGASMVHTRDTDLPTRIVTTPTATSARRGSGRRSRSRRRRSSPRKTAAARTWRKRRRLRFCVPPFPERRGQRNKHTDRHHEKQPLTARHHDGGAAQPSTPREAARFIAQPPANDDRSRRRRRSPRSSRPAEATHRGRSAPADGVAAVPQAGRARRGGLQATEGCHGTAAARRRRMNGLPTPRMTLRARYVSLLVWCKGGCQPQAFADLQALMEAGRRAADAPAVPLFQLRQRSSAALLERGPDRSSLCVADDEHARAWGLALWPATLSTDGGPARAAFFVPARRVTLTLQPSCLKMASRRIISRRVGGAGRDPCRSSAGIRLAPEDPVTDEELGELHLYGRALTTPPEIGKVQGEGSR